MTPHTIIERTEYHNARGFLNIGDPHLWSKQPGRRLDEDFLQTLLNKLEEASVIANNNKLIALILGDLFHCNDDYEPKFLSRVVEILQKFHFKPITLVGNHEKEEWILSKRDALSLLEITGQINTIHSNGPFGTFTFQGIDREYRVLLGGTPYGQKVPLSLSDAVQTQVQRGELSANEYHQALKNDTNFDYVLWVTHDDFAFENTYPGAKPMHSIPGIDLVINGHMHGTKKPFLAENTVWHNPGNITRLSIDMVDHIPTVWEWTPENNLTTLTSQGLKVSGLTPHPLKHTLGSTIFNQAGYHAKKINVPEKENTYSSQFVSLIKHDSTQSKTDDGIFIQEKIEEYMNEKKPVEAVRHIVHDLLYRCTKE